MANWMLRGLILAATMVVIRLLQGVLINAWQTQAGLIGIVLLLLFVIAVGAWGVLDGRADAATNPDPDRREDLAMTWLLAGLVAGVLSGAVSWLISLFYTGLYAGGVLNELTTFAAFTALMVFLPGIIGVALGRWQVDRKGPPAPKHDGSAQRVDTDVFAAVRADEMPTRDEIATGTAATEERTPPTAVATAEREDTTETIANMHEENTETIAIVHEDTTETMVTTEHQAPTKTNRTTERISATEMIRAHSDQTKPRTRRKPKKD